MAAIPDTMRALTLVGARVLSLDTVPVPAIRAGHVLIKTSYVGLCGADLLLYNGSSVYLKTGRKHYPFVFGHEWSGTVVAAAPDVRAFQAGDRVVGHNFITCEVCRFCRSGRRSQCTDRSEMGILGDYPGAASEYFSVPAKVLTPLPDSLPNRLAALLEPASTALHSVDRIAIRENDRVAVIGTGAVGLFAMQLAKFLGAQVHAIGVDPAGLDLAKSLGVDDILRPEEVPSSRYDAVIEASGAPAAVAQAGEIVAPAGRIALVGIAHHPVSNFPAAELVIKDVELQAVLSGIDQWDRLVDLAGRGALQLEELIEEIVPFTRAADAFESLEDPRRTHPKVLLEFDAAKSSQC